MRRGNNKIVKTSALILAATISLTSVSFADTDTAKDKAVEKYETVFVNLNNNGTQKQKIVSNWLKNSDELTSLVDNTDLKDVKSIVGENTMNQEGDRIQWDIKGSDVYYQGITNRDLPIDTEIKYYLNDVIMDPKDMVGKSGKVKIVLKVKNKTKQNFTVDGKTKSVSTPFTAVAVVGLPTETFSNVELDNGKMFSDGSNQMVIFIGFPSLKDSLNIDNTAIDELKDIDIPDTLTITADAKDFELSPIGIVATPELPDMIKDIKNPEDLDIAQSDIDRVIHARDVLDELDPNDTIKSIITDPEKTGRAKILIDDIFEFYDLDKALFDKLPDYINEENIELFDRTRDHLRDADIRYVMDNQVLKYIPDRMDDAHINKSRVLLKDYDEIKDFEMERFDKVVDVLDDYDDMKLMIDTGLDLYDKIKKHDKEMDVLDKLSKYSDRAEGIIDDFRDLDVSNSDIDDMINAATQVLIRTKTDEYERKLGTSDQSKEALKDKLRPFLTKKLEDLSPSDMQTIMSLPEVKAVISATGKSSEEMQQALAQMASAGVTVDGLIENLSKQINGNIESQVSSAVNAMVNDTRYVLYKARDLKNDIEQDLGYNYSADIRSSMDFINDIMPELRTIRSQEKANRDKVQKAVDLAENEDDIRYFQHWSHRIKEMKKDMDDNSDNIEVLRDILNQYDDPKIKHFYDMIPTLRDDMEDARPIAESFSDLLDDPVYDTSFHKSPETIDTVLKMKDDMENSRDITEAMRLALDDRIIEVARDVIEIMDRRDDAGDLDKAKDQIDSLQDLMDRKDAIEELSDRYTTFTGSSDGIKSNVRFVMKTDELEKDDDDDEFIPQEDSNKSLVKKILKKLHLRK